MAAAVLGVALIALSCGEGRGEAARDPGASATGTSLVPSDDPLEVRHELVSLLAQDERFAHDEASLMGAEQQLLASCMSAAGFSYIAADGRTLVTPLYAAVPDVDRRREVGYGIGISDGPAPTNDEYVRTLPAEMQQAYRIALFGSGEPLTIDLPDGSQQVLQTGGCIGSARAEIYGSIESSILVEPVMSAHADLVGRAVAVDPRFLQAMASWSTCMAAHGYPFDDPQAAHDHVERLVAANASDARSTEIELAVQDAECAIEAGVPGAIAEVAAEYVGSLSTDGRADIIRAADLRAAAVRKAERWQASGQGRDAG